MVLPGFRFLSRRRPEQGIPRSRCSRRGRCRPPTLETLEDRLAPAAIQWINPAGGAWEVTGNWSGGRVPGAGDDVTIDLPGNINVTHSTGTDSINSLTSQESLTFSGGSLAIAAASSISALTLTGGTLTGSGAVTVTGQMTWTAGTMSGSGRTVVAAGAEATLGGGTKILDARSFDNAGTVTWTAGDIYGSNGAVWTNQAGSLFDAQTDRLLHNYTGAQPTFANAGTFRKSAGAGTTTVGWRFDNSGTLDVQSGTVSLSGGGSSSGTFTAATSASVLISTGTYTLQAGATSSGAGVVLLSGGTLTITGDASLHNLTQSSGTLSGSGAVTVTGQLTWTGGTMSGSGRTVVAAGAGATLSGPSAKVLDARSFDNAGTVTWTAGDIYGSNGAIWTNQAGSLFDAQNDRLLHNYTGAQPTFANAGTFRKSAGTATATTVGWRFDNSGTLDVQSGTVSLSGGGSGNGTFTEATGATLQFSAGTYTLQAGATGAGTGTVRIAGATVNLGGDINLPNVSLSSGGTFFAAGNLGVVGLTQSGGTLTGAGAVTVTGQMSWTGGTMSGSGRTVVAAGAEATLGGTSAKVLDARSFDNAGTVTWTAGDIYGSNGAVWTNQAGSLFDAQNDRLLHNYTGAQPTFANAGTFRKSAGAGTTTVGWRFDNTGALDVQSGTVSLTSGGSSSGTFTAATSASVLISTGTYALQAGATSSGAGIVLLSGGTLTITGDAALRNLTQSSGTLSGAGAVTVTGQLTWTGGTMSGSGRTVVAAGAEATLGGGTKILDARSFDNAGTVTWTAGDIYGATGAVWTNQAGSLFDAQNDRLLHNYTGAQPTFANAGTFRKSAGAGTTTVGWRFDNTGTLDVQSGTVSLTGVLANFSGTTLTGGAFLVRGTLQFPGAAITTNAASIVLDGTAARIVNSSIADALANFTANASGGSFTLRNGRIVTTTTSFSNAGSLTIGATSMLAVATYRQTGGSTALDGGTLTASQSTVDIQAGSLSGSGTVTGNLFSSGTVSPGSSAGLLTVTGTYGQGPGGSLNVELAGPAPDQYDRLAVSGAATLDGALNVSLLDGFVPNAGDSFPVLTAGSRLSQFAQVNGPRFGGRESFRADHGPAGVTLVVVASGVHITPNTGLVTTEAGGADTFDVVLDAQPSADVTFTLSSSDTTEGTVSPASLTFTLANWNVARTVTVTGIDDDLVDGDVALRIVTGPADSDDPAYLGLDPSDVFVTNRDNDTRDLQVQNLQVEPADLLSGTSLVVRWDDVNPGDHATVTSWSDQVVIRNATTGKTLATASVAYDAAAEGALGPGQSRARQYALSLPLGAPGAGRIEFTVTADSANQVFERNADGTAESNNAATLARDSTRADPDLQVDNLRVEPAAGLQSGTSLVVRWDDRNANNGAVTGSFHDLVSIRNVTTGEVLGTATVYCNVGTEGAILPGEARGRQYAFTLPDGPRGAGQIEFTVTTDYYNGVAEYNVAGTAESNNTSAITRDSTLADYPDLTVAAVNGPRYARAGQLVNVSWVLTNQGFAALANQTWVESVFLSADQLAGGDTFLGSFTFSDTLNVGQTIDRTDLQVRMPGNVSSGGYYFVVVVDSRAEVFEYSEINNAAATAEQVRVPNTLTLTTTKTRVEEGAAPARVRVTRSGGIDQPVDVTLVSTDTTELSVPASVTIPAGFLWAEFDATAVQDSAKDGDQAPSLFARVLDDNSQDRPDYSPAVLGFTVLDTAVPDLILTLSATEVAEGRAVLASVSRNPAVNSAPMLVALSDNGNNQLALPTNVTLPEGIASITFTIQASVDALLEADRFYRITAHGYGTATADLIVRDMNRRDLAVTTAGSTIAENSHVPLVGTVTRPVVTNLAQVVALRSNRPDRLGVPAQVTIPANQASVSFPITPADNVVQGDSVDVHIAAFAVDPIDRVTLVLPGGSTPVTVQDNDSPALTLTLDRGMLPEDSATPARGTVRRNTLDNSAPLVVTLASSDPGGAAVSPTVTIPAGSDSVTFDVIPVDDRVPGGTRLVTVSAAANGFNAGSARIFISDVDKPDLRITDVFVQPTGLTDETVIVSYTSRNEGRQPVNAGWIDRIYLSADAFLSADDTMLTHRPMFGPLAAGVGVPQTASVRLPATAGTCYLIVSTDIVNVVDEIFENNNIGISGAIQVNPAYSATVSADVHQAVMGTPVTLRGQATLAGGGLGANVPLTVRVTHEGGFRRILNVTSDATGAFAATFTPLPNEAGDYAVAVAHPGVGQDVTQDRFTLIGMQVSPPGASHKLIAGQSVTQQLELRNLSAVALTDVRWEVIGATANLQVTVVPPSLAELPGKATRPFQYTVAALDHSIRQTSFTIRLTAAEGPSVAVPVSVRVEPVLARLTTPDGLTAGMLRGTLTPVEFTLTNDGGSASGDVSVLLPDAPWLTVASGAAIPSLAPGQSTTVSLLLNPAADLALGPYAGTVVLTASNLAGSLSIPFTFTATSDAKGDLAVEVVDEGTYFADGAPRLAGATVNLIDVFSRQVFRTGTTGADGRVMLAGIPEGAYDLEVKAARHDTTRSTIIIAPGQATEQLVFLRTQLVTYNWTVVPVAFEDRTKIVIESVFQTNVPAPVITVDPNAIDLAEVQAGYQQIDLKLTNHGLIQAEQLRLTFPDHPLWSLTPLIDMIPALPAKSEVIIPVIIRRKLGGQAADLFSAAALAVLEEQGAGGGCSFGGGVQWVTPCGPFGVPYSVPIPILNASGDCGGSGPGGSGPSGSPPSGSVVFTGASSGGNAPVSVPGISSPVFNFVSPEVCECTPGERKRLAGMSLTPYLSPVSGAVSNALRGVSVGVARLDQADVSAEGSFGIDVVCGADGRSTCIGYSGSASVSVDAKFTYNIAGGQISRSWSDPVHDYTFTAGAGIPVEIAGNITGSITVSGGCGEPLQVCGSISGSVTPSISVGAQGTVKRTNRLTGETVTDGVEASLRLSTGFSTQISYCNTSGLSSQACFEGVTLTGTLRASGLIEGEQTWEQNLAERRCTSSMTSFDVTSTGLPQTAEDYARLLDEALRIGAAGSDGVCAQVRLRLDQEAVLTRTAFDATLEIDNGDTNKLDDLQVFLAVTDAATGAQVDDRFAISLPQVTQFVPNSDGTTEGPPSFELPGQSEGTYTLTLLPTELAAPTGPTQYQVGGLVIYTLNGSQRSIVLAPSTITVYPDAALHLNYFHQRDVFADDPFTEQTELSVPYDLGVLVTNTGAGAARDLRITSAQPKIIENEKGLLIDFQIVGSEVDGQASAKALTVNLGDVEPGSTHAAIWHLTSTLQGHFTEYKASFEHLTGFGDKRTSLIKEVAIHELTHTVRDARPGADALPDFLANDVSDDAYLPDTLYLSDGTVAPVGVGTYGGVDGAAAPGHLAVRLRATMPTGWGYLAFKDPSGGQYRLAQVLRTDGTEVPLGANAWTTDRTFKEDGRRPVYEDRIHLLDFNGADTYTLVFRSFDQTGPTVASIQEVSPDPTETAIDTLDVTFSELLAAGSFDADDLTLTRDGGANLIDAVTVTKLNDTTYRVAGLAGLTSANGTYAFTVSGADVADIYDNAGTGSAQRTWIMAAGVVSVTALDNLPGGPSNATVAFADVTFSRPINPGTFDAADLNLTRDGVSQDLAGVAITPLSETTYRLGGLAALTGTDSAYHLAVNAAGVQDFAGASGVGTATADWARDTVVPEVQSLADISLNPRNTVVLAADVTFSEAIDLASFDRTDLTLTRNGGSANLIDSRVTVEHLSGSAYRIKGFNWVVGLEGTYTLTVHGPGIRDAAGNDAVGAASVGWVMDTTKPAAPMDLAISPDRGVSATDRLTSTGSITLTGTLAEPGLTLRVRDATTQADLGSFPTPGTTFRAALDLVGAAKHRLVAYAVDAASNVSPNASLEVVIDTAMPAVTWFSDVASPRPTGLDGLDVTFSEEIDPASFGTAALSLTRDGGANLIGAGVTVARVSATTYHIGGLTDPTGVSGLYTLTIDETRIQDLAGNPGTTASSIGWRVVVPGEDGVAPESSVQPLTSPASTARFTVSWSGQDNPGGSGLASYDVFVSVDSGPFQVWLSAATVTSAAFNGDYGHRYAFYSRARDHAGNAEEVPAQADAETSTPGLGKITGFIFNDTDADRQWERDAGEPGLGGWFVYLDQNLNGRLDAGERTTTTNADGSYEFTDLPPNTYTVAEVLRDGWQQTFPGSALVSPAGLEGGTAETAPADAPTLFGTTCGCKGVVLPASLVHADYQRPAFTWHDADPSTPELDIYYDFRPIGSYLNQITAGQVAMAERAMRMWEQGAMGRIRFVRNTAAPIQDVINVGTGDLAALGYTSGPRRVIGLGGGIYDVATGRIRSGVAWLDVAEQWEETYGNGNVGRSFDYFTVVAHEIGHALGLGHTDSVPGPNIMNGTYGGEKTALTAADQAMVQLAYMGGTVAVSGGAIQSLDAPGVHTVAIALGQIVEGVNFGNHRPDVTPPAPPAALAVSPDTGASASDGVTSTGQVTLSGELGEADLRVHLFDVTADVSLGDAAVTGAAFSTDLVLAAGPHRLRVRALDAAGNHADSFFDVFIDLTPPEATGGPDVPTGPIAAPLDAVDVVFSEGLDLLTFDHQDLTLARDGGPNLVTADVKVEAVPGTPSTYRISGLGAVTGRRGGYELTVHAGAIRDLAGNAGVGAASGAWVNNSLVATTTGLTATPAAAVFGQPITLAAAVAAANPADGTPAGEVVFHDDSTEIGRAPLDGGVATLVVALPVGPHSVTASFTPAGAFAGSTSAARAVHVARPAQVAGVLINDGQAQRSMVNSLTVTFDGNVTLLDGAFQLTRQGTGTAVGLVINRTVIGNITKVVLTFTGSGIVGGSLADGRYTLTTRGERIRDANGAALDGDKDGQSGGDRTDTFHRLFGDADGLLDANGKATLSLAELTALRNAQGKSRGQAGYLWYFDYNNDGRIDSVDYTEARNRYVAGVTF